MAPSSDETETPLPEDDIKASLDPTPITPSRTANNEVVNDVPSSPGKSATPSRETTPTTVPGSPMSPTTPSGAEKLLSPSPMRLTSGLSELSKQLRALQAQNEAKNAEIDRLKRQIQILADLQGISVANLRKALDDACEAAALEELQSRVAGLKAQLEAVHAVQGKSVTEDIMAKKVANLELKVGELEELDERQRKEKRELFSRLREKADQVAQLEGRVLHLESENKQLHEKLEVQSNMVVANAVIEEAAVETEAKESLGKPISATAVETKVHGEIVANLETKLRDTESQLQTTMEKLKLSDEQKQSEGEQAALRNSQFKARFMVQEENIRDLEQQLSSLYTAFTLLRDERDAEEAHLRALQSSLGQADAMVARLQSTREQQQPQQQQQPQGKTELVPILSTPLWVRGSGNFRKWKKHPAVLYSSMSHYVLDISLGKTFNIYFDLAKVSQHRLQVFGFIIHLNPNDDKAPQLYLAALNKEEYAQWMEALNAAISNSATNDSSRSSSHQEELELERALKLSEQEK